MANETTNRYLNIYIQSGEAQKTLDTLLAKEKKLTEELGRTTDPKKIKQLQDGLAKLAEPIDRATRKIKGELSPSLKEVQTTVNNLGNRLKRMSTEDADFTKVLSEYKEAKVLLNELRRGVDQIGTSQQSLKKESFLGSFFGNLTANLVTNLAGKVSDLFTGSFGEALEAEEKTARLKATLDNLGRTEVFDRMIAKANEMAQRFKYLDNDDVIGVFDSLITYGKLTEKQMNDLLPVIVDFSAKQRISLQEGTSVILKALEGSAKGLKEYGINIKDAKTETERLELIMGTLADKVAGAGDTFQNTAAGGIAAARQEFRNLQEEIGTGLIPMLNKLLSFTLKAINNLKSFGNAVAAELNGKSGFIQIALDEIDGNAVLQQSVQDQTDQFIKTITNAQKEIEESPSFKAMGKLKLDLTKEEDKKILQDNQKKRIDNIKAQLQVEKERLEVLKESGRRSDQQEARSLEMSIRARKAALTGIDGILNPQTAVLGIDAGGGSGNDDKEKQRKIQDEIRRLAEERRKLIEELKKIEDALSISSLNALDKELALLDIKYARLNVMAHGEAELLLRIQDDFQKERLKVIELAGGKEVDAWAKSQVDIGKKTDELFKENIERVKAMTTRLEAATFGGGEERDAVRGDDKAAKIELDILKAKGKVKLDLQLADLQRQEEVEVDAAKARGKKAGLTEEAIQNTIAGIRDKYDSASKEKQLAYYTDILTNVTNYAQQGLAIFNQIGDLKTAKENAEVEADRKRNDKKKAQLDRRLKAGLITQVQYQREVDKMDKEQRKKEHEAEVKQFNRKKKASIIEALINGAVAVTSALGNAFPLNIIMVALTVATTALQIAAISKQKPPELARGGKLGGRSHSEGGNPILDGRTGRKIAEIEGGEGVVNKHTMSDRKQYQLSGTPSQIISMLNAQGGGVHWEHGATMKPRWMTAKQPGINYPAIRKYYAAGGKFDTGASSLADTAQQQNNDVLKDLSNTMLNMQATIDAMNNTLANGINSYTILTQTEKQQARLNAIRADATLKR